jgi:hypothetical protein
MRGSGHRGLIFYRILHISAYPVGENRGMAAQYGDQRGVGTFGTRLSGERHQRGGDEEESVRHRTS